MNTYSAGYVVYTWGLFRWWASLVISIGFFVLLSTDVILIFSKYALPAIFMDDVEYNLNSLHVELSIGNGESSNLNDDFGNIWMGFLGNIHYLL